TAPGKDGTYNYKNLMLNIGSTALPFEPQNNDYVFYDVSLHSNIDGTVTDELFFRDGKPYKLKRFEEVILDGSLAWEFSQDQTGYKQVRIPLSNALKDSFPMAAKYDGKILKIVNPDFSLGSDEVYHHSNGYTYLSIADTDSGWPEAWAGTTLTKTGSLTRDVTASDFIKAYFNGWKWDDTNKRWHLPGDPNSWSYDVDYVIRTYAATLGTPYRLLYQLAQPVEVPASSEGEISLHEGDNLLEVGTGLVWREPVVPVDNGNNEYQINAEINPLKFVNSKILSVYKGETKGNFTIKTRDISSPYRATLGADFAVVPKGNYDPTAAYSVTYLVRDKYLYTAPLLDTQAEYRTKLAGVVAETVQDIADLAKRVSVVETQYARKQQGQWIVPVLLNGYTNVYQSGYYKDEMGIVRLRGRLGIGTTSNSTVIFYLPVGYRPSQNLFVHTPSGDIYIGTDGSIRIYNYASNTGAPNVVLIDGISFRAEQ
ncbi:hypothetical protein P4T20_15790, partial [Aneurinibacillus thermoaerophilus]|nr:hypothetical protein [Aneurinibacillus thermoaerophilus]